MNSDNRFSDDSVQGSDGEDYQRTTGFPERSGILSYTFQTVQRLNCHNRRKHSLSRSISQHVDHSYREKKVFGSLAHEESFSHEMFADTNDHSFSVERRGHRRNFPKADTNKQINPVIWKIKSDTVHAEKKFIPEKMPENQLLNDTIGRPSKCSDAVFVTGIMDNKYTPSQNWEEHMKVLIATQSSCDDLQNNKYTPSQNWEEHTQVSSDDLQNTCLTVADKAAEILVKTMKTNNERTDPTANEKSLIEHKHLNKLGFETDRVPKICKKVTFGDVTYKYIETRPRATINKRSVCLNQKIDKSTSSVHVFTSKQSVSQENIKNKIMADALKKHLLTNAKKACSSLNIKQKAKELKEAFNKQITSKNIKEQKMKRSVESRPGCNDNSLNLKHVGNGNDLKKQMQIRLQDKLKGEKKNKSDAIKSAREDKTTEMTKKDSVMKPTCRLIENRTDSKIQKMSRSTTCQKTDKTSMKDSKRNEQYLDKTRGKDKLLHSRLKNEVWYSSQYCSQKSSTGTEEVSAVKEHQADILTHTSVRTSGDSGNRSQKRKIITEPEHLKCKYRKRNKESLNYERIPDKSAALGRKPLISNNEHSTGLEATHKNKTTFPAGSSSVILTSNRVNINLSYNKDKEAQIEIRKTAVHKGKVCSNNQQIKMMNNVSKVVQKKPLSDGARTRKHSENKTNTSPLQLQVETVRESKMLKGKSSVTDSPDTQKYEKACNNEILSDSDSIPSSDESSSVTEKIGHSFFVFYNGISKSDIKTKKDKPLSSLSSNRKASVIPDELAPVTVPYLLNYPNTKETADSNTSNMTKTGVLPIAAKTLDSNSHFHDQKASKLSIKSALTPYKHYPNKTKTTASAIIAQSTATTNVCPSGLTSQSKLGDASRASILSGTSYGNGPPLSRKAFFPRSGLNKSQYWPHVPLASSVRVPASRSSHFPENPQVFSTHSSYTTRANGSKWQAETYKGTNNMLTGSSSAPFTELNTFCHSAKKPGLVRSQNTNFNTNSSDNTLSHHQHSLTVFNKVHDSNRHFKDFRKTQDSATAGNTTHTGCQISKAHSASKSSTITTLRHQSARQMSSGNKALPTEMISSQDAFVESHHAPVKARISPYSAPYRKPFIPQNSFFGTRISPYSAQNTQPFIPENSFFGTRISPYSAQNTQPFIPQNSFFGTRISPYSAQNTQPFIPQNSFFGNQSFAGNMQADQSYARESFQQFATNANLNPANPNSPLYNHPTNHLYIGSQLAGNMQADQSYAREGFQQFSTNANLNSANQHINNLNSQLYNHPTNRLYLGSQINPFSYRHWQSNCSLRYDRFVNYPNTGGGFHHMFDQQQSLGHFDWFRSSESSYYSSNTLQANVDAANMHSTRHLDGTSAGLTNALGNQQHVHKVTGDDTSLISGIESTPDTSSNSSYRIQQTVASGEGKCKNNSSFSTTANVQVTNTISGGLTRDSSLIISKSDDNQGNTTSVAVPVSDISPSLTEIVPELDLSDSKLITWALGLLDDWGTEPLEEKKTIQDASGNTGDSDNTEKCLDTANRSPPVLSPISNTVLLNEFKSNRTVDNESATKRDLFENQCNQDKSKCSSAKETKTDFYLKSKPRDDIMNKTLMKADKSTSKSQISSGIDYQKFNNNAEYKEISKSSRGLHIQTASTDDLVKQSAFRSDSLAGNGEDGTKPSPIVTKKNSVIATDTDRISPQPSVRNRISPQPSVRISPQPSVRNRISPQPSVRNRISPQPSVRNRISPQPSVRNETTTTTEGVGVMISKASVKQLQMCSVVNTNTSDSEKVILPKSPGAKSVTEKDSLSINSESEKMGFVLHKAKANKEKNIRSNLQRSVNASSPKQTYKTVVEEKNKEFDIEHELLSVKSNENVPRIPDQVANMITRSVLRQKSKNTGIPKDQDSGVHTSSVSVVEQIVNPEKINTTEKIHSTETHNSTECEHVCMAEVTSINHEKVTLDSSGIIKQSECSAVNAYKHKNTKHKSVTQNIKSDINKLMLGKRKVQEQSLFGSAASFLGDDFDKNTPRPKKRPSVYSSYATENIKTKKAIQNQVAKPYDTLQYQSNDVTEQMNQELVELPVVSVVTEGQKAEEVSLAALQSDKKYKRGRPKKRRSNSVKEGDSNDTEAKSSYVKPVCHENALNELELSDHQSRSKTHKKNKYKAASEMRVKLRDIMVRSDTETQTLNFKNGGKVVGKDDVLSKDSMHNSERKQTYKKIDTEKKDLGGMKPPQQDRKQKCWNRETDKSVSASKRKKKTGTVSLVKETPCQICKMRFKSTELLGHIRKFHPKHCQVCYKEFPSKKAKQKHKIDHAAELYECLQCDRKFSQAGHLNAHLKYCKKRQIPNERETEQAVASLVNVLHPSETETEKVVRSQILQSDDDNSFPMNEEECTRTETGLGITEDSCTFLTEVKQSDGNTFVINIERDDNYDPQVKDNEYLQNFYETSSEMGTQPIIITQAEMEPCKQPDKLNSDQDNCNLNLLADLCEQEKKSAVPFSLSSMAWQGYYERGSEGELLAVSGDNTDISGYGEVSETSGGVEDSGDNDTTVCRILDTFSLAPDTNARPMNHY